MLTNGDLSLLLQRAGDAEQGHRRRALHRAGRAALMWPEEASWTVAAGGDLESLAGVGPWIAARIAEWLDQPPDLGEPDELRNGFLTRAQVRAVLSSHPEWIEGLHGDLQMHTTDSDGRSPLPEMVDAAEMLGRSFVAVTDHSKSLRIAKGMDEAHMLEQGRRIDALNRRLVEEGRSIRVLRSIEMDVFVDGSGDMDPAALAGLDVVLGAFHTGLRTRDDQTERYLAALRNPTVDVLAHPRTRKFGRRAGLRADWPAVFQEAARLGKAVEIDASPDRQDLDVELIRSAREAGVLISIGSDAHNPGELEFMEFGLAAAIEAGIPRERILNFWSATEVMEWAGAERAR
jgi:histidinol phosphatase-like PHP family hydrolase